MSDPEDGPPAGPPEGPWFDPWRGERRRHRPSTRSYERHRAWLTRHRERPNWWPEDAEWPPQGEFPWRRVRRQFFARFALVVFLVFILVILAPLIVIGEILAALGLPGHTTWLLGVVFLLVLFLVVARIAGSARRFALPFGDLIEAAGRVEAGDYTARVAPYGRGPRELRSLVGAFNAMAARLEADERQRRSLLADVSHELRTPLTVLRGELEAMIDGVHPIDEAHLTEAVDQIGMLTKLVEDLRTLALAEGGTLPLHKEPTDLAVLAGEAAASFEVLAAAGGVRLEVAMPGDLPLVDVDPLRIQQVVGNLVANALRYSPSGGTVSIAGKAGPRTVTVSVTDGGPGIAPDVLPHLFERFAKADDSRGSGLGLAIARQLVEAHGGSIWAVTPAAGGTTISFELPTRSRA
jgi:two-component system sensor histidine kinase BaeS